MKTPKEKYENDPQYSRLVDYLTILISDANFTPSEVREAAVYACIRYEMLYVRQLHVPFTGPVLEALKTIEEWQDELCMIDKKGGK